MESRLSTTPLPGGPPPSLRMTVEPAMPDASTRNDDAVLAILRRDLGEAMFRDVLAGLEDELERRLRSARAPPRDWDALREDAQAMLSLAVGFGFGTLAELSRAVLSACERPAHRSPDPLRPYVAEVRHRLAAIAAISRASIGTGDVP